MFNRTQAKLYRLYVIASAHWKSIRTSNQDHIEYLNHIGTQKPVGYTCYYGMSLKKDWDARKIKDAMHIKGLKTKSFKKLGGWQSPVHTLCVYHEDSLSQLLDNNKAVLDRYGWNTNPEDFIDNIMNKQAPVKSDLFDLIADAFADHKNWWRTDQEIPEDILNQALQSIEERPNDYAQPII